MTDKEDLSTDELLEVIIPIHEGMMFTQAHTRHKRSPEAIEKLERDIQALWQIRKMIQEGERLLSDILPKLERIAERMDIGVVDELIAILKPKKPEAEVETEYVSDGFLGYLVPEEKKKRKKAHKIRRMIQDAGKLSAKNKEALRKFREYELPIDTTLDHDVSEDARTPKDKEAWGGYSPKPKPMEAASWRLRVSRVWFDAASAELSYDIEAGFDLSHRLKAILKELGVEVEDE